MKFRNLIFLGCLPLLAAPVHAQDPPKTQVTRKFTKQEGV